MSAFGNEVASQMPAAWWKCARPGSLQVHAHAGLTEALACGGGVQAFLPLPAGAEPPKGSIIGSGVVPEAGLAVAALVEFLPTIQRPADLFSAGYLEAGRLSVSFAEALKPAVDQVWTALERVTEPAVGEGRIGPTASRAALRSGSAGKPGPGTAAR